MVSAQIKIAWNESDGGAFGTSTRDQVFAGNGNLNCEFTVGWLISPDDYQ